MKVQTTVLSVMILSAFAIADIAQAKPRAERRQNHQMKRIRHGNAQGQLTRGEENALRKQQEHMDRRIQKMEEGGLTDAEKLKVEKMQDRASRKIHRLNNNGRKVEDAGDAPAGAEAVPAAAPAPASE